MWGCRDSRETLSPGSMCLAWPCRMLCVWRTQTNGWIIRHGMVGDSRPPSLSFNPPLHFRPPPRSLRAVCLCAGSPCSSSPAAAVSSAGGMSSFDPRRFCSRKIGSKHPPDPARLCLSYAVKKLLSKQISTINPTLLGFSGQISLCFCLLMQTGQRGKKI